MTDDVVAPHCDPAILHAPGRCDSCDGYPDWQALRRLWGICFTGETPVMQPGGPAYEFMACPSDYRRPGGVSEQWPGNRAVRHD